MVFLIKMVNKFIYLFLFSISLSINYSDNIFSSAPFKTIDFYYIIDLYDAGVGSLVIGPNNYKLELAGNINNITISSDQVISKRYDKETNQIFIENSIPEIDSIFLTFLSKEFFETYNQINDSSIYINYGFNNLSSNLILNNNLDSIILVKIFNEKIKFTASEIDFKSDSVINMDIFKIYAKDAFILDLRY